jgi:hypothetical protein
MPKPNRNEIQRVASLGPPGSGKYLPILWVHANDVKQKKTLTVTFCMTNPDGNDAGDRRKHPFRSVATVTVSPSENFKWHKRDVEITSGCYEVDFETDPTASVTQPVKLHIEASVPGDPPVPYDNAYILP